MQRPIWAACTNIYCSNIDSSLFTCNLPCERQSRRPFWAACVNTNYSNSDWDRKAKLYEPAVSELQYWIANVKRLNGFKARTQKTYDVVCYSDTSDEGYGGYNAADPNSPVRGLWTTQEAENSSTWRELTAVYRTFLGIRDQLKNKSIKWFTDNQAVSSIVQTGSRNPRLQDIAIALINIAQQSNSELDIQWIPRKENSFSRPIYSRWADRDGWTMHNRYFEWLDRLWGPHTVNRFAKRG